MMFSICLDFFFFFWNGLKKCFSVSGKIFSTKQPLTFKLRGKKCDSLEFVDLSKQLFWRRSQCCYFAICLLDRAENDSGLDVFQLFLFLFFLNASWVEVEGLSWYIERVLWLNVKAVLHIWCSLHMPAIKYLCSAASLCCPSTTLSLSNQTTAL